MARKAVHQRIWQAIVSQKYKKTQCLESEHFLCETMFMRENRNLEAYFWK